MSFLRHLSLTLILSAPLVALAQISITMPPSTTARTPLNQTSQTISWAQTFVTPDATHTRLDHVEFRIGQQNGASDFAVYLVQWNSTSQALTGAPLWTSAIQSTVSLPTYPAFGEISFDTSGIDLQPNQSYALVFFDPTPSSSSGVSRIGANWNNPYPAGGLYELWRGTASTSFNDLYSAAVYDSSGFYDLAFGATFSAPGLTAVPEPATAVAVLGLAFVAGLVALRLHQRRRATAPATSSPA